MSRLVAQARAVRSSGDAGQLMLLILAYAVIAALLVTVVVNVSKVFLVRRSLVAAADAAALNAANQADESAVYDGAGAALPLDAAASDRAVRRYARDATLWQRFDGFDVVEVQSDGVTVTVTFRSAVSMPFLNLLSSDYAEGYPVLAVARATATLGP